MTTAPASASHLPNRLEVHDPGALARAREVLDTCGDFRAMGEAVKAAVARNAAWRGEQCINLLAPEAPTSPSVRALLSSEIGTRAADNVSYYSDIDMMAHAGSYTHRDGTPYPKAERRGP